ncbi:MAG: hypothetical protein DME09_19400 [Candidatus Rokuibacteriota bacterium]|nr:MAG: hypothetical protein DME09_19400 [Candidatus Rokubacteria bacterium]
MSDPPAHPVRRVVWRVCAVAAAVLLAGLIAVDIRLAWNVIRVSRLERETARTRAWEPTALALRADQLRIPGGRGPLLIATTETRCSGSRLYYTLSVRKNPRCCAAGSGDGAAGPVAAILLDLVSLDDLLSSVRRFTIRFIDEQGATLKTVVVARRQVYLQSDHAGGVGAGEASAGVPWDCGAYSHVTRVVVESEEFREKS